jgi:hypothetical protein
MISMDVGSFTIIETLYSIFAQVFTKGIVGWQWIDNEVFTLS